MTLVDWLCKINELLYRTDNRLSFFIIWTILFECLNKNNIFLQTLYSIIPTISVKVSNSISLWFAEKLFQPLHSFHAKYCKTSILQCLCHAEQYEPKHALERCTDRQCHLCERQDIAWNTAEKHDHSCAERKPAQPLTKIIQQNFHYIILIIYWEYLFDNKHCY